MINITAVQKILLTIYKIRWLSVWEEKRTEESYPNLRAWGQNILEQENKYSNVFNLIKIVNKTIMIIESLLIIRKIYLEYWTING